MESMPVTAAAQAFSEGHHFGLIYGMSSCGLAANWERKRGEAPGLRGRYFERTTE